MDTTSLVTEARRTSPYPGDDDAIGWASQLVFAHHACCCSAQPLVVAVLPPTAARPHPSDLLLCGHHYRMSRGRLAAVRARVFDANGVRLDAQGEGYSAFPEPAMIGVPV